VNYLDTLKNISKDSKRKRENLILLLVLLVVLLISVNYIFKSGKNTKNSTLENNKSQSVTTQSGYSDTLESKISQVLSQISGVSEVSIIINYANEGNDSIVYDTKETLNENGQVTNIEKSVAYNESGSEKNAIIEVKNAPTVEGVLVVAKGVEGSEIKQRLSAALGNLLGIPSYKVQVFEK